MYIYIYKAYGMLRRLYPTNNWYNTIGIICKSCLLHPTRNVNVSVIWRRYMNSHAYSLWILYLLSRRSFMNENSRSWKSILKGTFIYIYICGILWFWMLYSVKWYCVVWHTYSFLVRTYWLIVVIKSNDMLYAPNIIQILSILYVLS